MISTREPAHVDVVVIGAGQAGLATGYYLARRGLSFAILEQNERVGDTWRRRWDSLRLFTPAHLDGIVGMPFPGPKHAFPTKDAMADYLEQYAVHFNLPVRTGVRVERVSRDGERFIIAAGDLRIEAENVVVAMGNYQKPRIPAFAADLSPKIVQLHSIDYRNPSQLQDGDVLLVGAGNSGSEIAMELARGRQVWMSGTLPGHVPFRIEGTFARVFGIRFVIRFLFHRVLTLSTPIGRKVRPKMLTHAGPLVRVKPGDMDAVGVKRVPRTVGTRHGLPLLEDDRVMDIPNVIWCTGFHPGFSWIDLPVFGEHEPLHYRGVVESEPGLYFVGLEFLYAASSTMIHGVSRDAEHVVKAIDKRMRSRTAAAALAASH